MSDDMNGPALQSLFFLRRQTLMEEPQFKDREGRRWRPLPEQLAQLPATEAELGEQRARVVLREMQVAEVRDAHHEAELRASSEEAHRRAAEARAAAELRATAAPARAAELEALLVRLTGRADDAPPE